MSDEATPWRLALSDGVPRRAFFIAVIVGTILTLINQGDVLLAGETPNWIKLVLTYCVPYVVSTHGAVSAALARRNKPGVVES
jgi:hypothetical protein